MYYMVLGYVWDVVQQCLGNDRRLQVKTFGECLETAKFVFQERDENEKIFFLLNIGWAKSLLSDELGLVKLLFNPVT